MAAMIIIMISSICPVTLENKNHDLQRSTPVCLFFTTSRAPCPTAKARGRPPLPVQGLQGSMHEPAAGGSLSRRLHTYILFRVSPLLLSVATRAGPSAVSNTPRLECLLPQLPAVQPVGPIGSAPGRDKRLSAVTCALVPFRHVQTRTSA